MTNEELILKAKEIKASCANTDNGMAAFAESHQFIKEYIGKSSFLLTLSKIQIPGSDIVIKNSVIGVMNALIRYLQKDLFQGISPERKGQLDTVTDFLELSQTLLDDNKVHGAAPAVIIGASLEEFLRSWTETEELDLGSKKPTMDSYAKVLRENESITKQDIKDITGWTGVRNDAAHGKWDNVKDKSRIRLMLEGVNLFMRKYHPEK